MPKFQPSMTVRAFGDDLIACIVDIEHTCRLRNPSRERGGHAARETSRGGPRADTMYGCVDKCVC